MCAQIASLPAPTPFYITDIMSPMIPVTWVLGVNPGNPEHRTIIPYFELFGGQSGWTSGGVGGTGVTDPYRAPLSILGRSFATSSAPVMQGHSPNIPWVTADPDDFNPGYENMEWSRVHIWNIRWHTDIAAGAPFNGETGFLFIPYDGTQFPSTLWPSGAAPLGGFGITAVDLGGAVQGWQYVCVDVVTGAVLDTEAIPLAVIPSVDEWTHAELVHVASGPGREAVLSLRVNGVSIFADKPFGTALLPRLQTFNPNAYCFSMTIRVGNPSNNQYTIAMRCRTGKFLLDGTEIRF